MNYNQIGDTELKNSCSVLAFLDFLKYEYFIDVSRDKIVVLLNWLEKAMAFSRLWGADAGIVYPAIQRYIRWKYGLEMKIEVHNITKIKDKRGYVLGFKGANQAYLGFTEDHEVTAQEVDKMKVSNGHFFYYEDGVVVDNLGGRMIKWSPELIQRAYDRGLFFYNTRRFSAGDDKTQNVLEEARRLGLARKKNKFKRPFLSAQELQRLGKLA